MPRASKKKSASKRKRRHVEEDDEKEEEENSSTDGRISSTTKRRRVSKANTERSSASSKQSSDYQIGDDSDNEDFVAKWTCNVIRGKIRKYLADGNSQASLRRDIGDVSRYHFAKFMKMKGSWDGRDNLTFEAATRFFLRLQKQSEAPAKERKTKSKTARRSGVEEESDDSDEMEEFVAKWTCNEIRGRIRRYLADGHSQVCFRKAIGGVNSNSFGRFMRMKGSWQGQCNGTFEGATRFFLRLAKLKKKRGTPSKTELAEKRKKKEKKGKLKGATLALVKRAEDSGYDDDSAVFDDCNDVRRKINKFLGKGFMSRAEFLRAIGGVQHRQLTSFLGMRPIRGAGAGNQVYRLGYHFFEKLRIGEGKPKTQKRLQNEAEMGTDGFSFIHDSGRRYCRRGRRPVIRDGRIYIVDA